MKLTTCQSYREFILYKLKENSNSRGYKTRLSRELKIQASYFSHILAGSAELSLDQAAALCDFWHLDSVSSDYFLTLVSLSRAGTNALREKLQKRLEVLRLEFEHSPRLVIPNVELDLQSAIDYYSHWYHVAIHACLGIPGIRTAEKIANKLKLPVTVVERSLDFLEKAELVGKERNEYFVNKPSLTPTSSLLKNLFYTEARKKAAESKNLDNPDGVHYSFSCTLSSADYQRLKAMIFEFAQNVARAVADTEEEDVAYFIIDWFRLGR